MEPLESLIAVNRRRGKTVRISPGFVHAFLLSDRYNVALCKRSLDRGEGAPLPPLMSGGGVCVKWKVRAGWKGRLLGKTESEGGKVGRT